MSENKNSTMAAPTSASDYNVSHSDKLMKKVKDAPFVPIGVAGMIGSVAWGAYSFRHRGNMSTSVFLMHLRVKAQGMVVGAMTAGVAYMLIKDYVLKKPSEHNGHHPSEHNGHHK